MFSSSNKQVSHHIVTTRGATLHQLLNNASFEITPGRYQEIDEAKKFLRPHTNIFIANIAGHAQAGLIDSIRAVSDAGLKAVPHLAARNIASVAELRQIAAAMKDTGTDSAFIIGGGAAQPAGPFPDAEQLLAHGEILAESGISDIGFGAYPEGHPAVDTLQLNESLWRKVEAARALGLKPFIVTQFCFEAAPILAWERRSRDLFGRRVPIRVGLAGATSVRKLLRYAAFCGVQASAAFLTGHAASMLTVLRKWTPEHLVSELSAAVAEDADCKIESFHFFPFGALETTAGLVRDVLKANEHLSREAT